MNRDEYDKKFYANQKISGQGIGNVFVHMPCPFCAEEDFVVYEVLQVEKALAKPIVCKHCQRGAKTVFTRDSSGVSFEIVQTSGEDPPDFLPPMRRVPA